MRRAIDLPSFPRAGDGLRLLALGRVPRCQRCPRFHQLTVGRLARGGPLVRLPEVPGFCTYQLCAPLVARYEPAAARRRGALLGDPNVARG